MGSRSFFIREVDGRILSEVKSELLEFYTDLMEEGRLELPPTIDEL